MDLAAQLSCRARKTSNYLVFSGDALSPSVQATITKGEHMVQIMNSMGVNLAVVGNHEFDFGLDNFITQAMKCNFIWLATNIKLENDVQIPCTVDHHIEIINGHIVGFIGIVEDFGALVATKKGELIITDPVEMAVKYCTKLRETCDYIVVLTHCENPNDILIAKAVADLADAVLGGHDHVVYEELVDGKIPLVKAGIDFKFLTTIDLASKLWSLTEISPNDEVDPIVHDMVNSINKKIDVLIDAPLIQSHYPIDCREEITRGGPCAIGSFLCNIYMSMLAAHMHIDLIMINGGGIRGNRIFLPGKLSMKNILTMMPFKMDMLILEVSGYNLAQALHVGRPIPGSGSTLHFSDSSIPKSIDPEKLYVVCCSSYVASGKGGFTSLIGAKVLVEEEKLISMQSCVSNFFRSIKVLSKFEKTKQLTFLNKCKNIWMKKDTGNSRYISYIDGIGGITIC